MTAPILHLAANRYAAGTRHDRHMHDELQISLVLMGRVEERVGDSVERGGALSVVVKDPGVYHANDFGARGATMARLFVPHLAFAKLAESGRETSWKWAHDGRAAAPFLRLVARGNAGERDFTHDDADVIDLVAAISARCAVTYGRAPAWLVDAVKGMTEGWHPALTVADAARAAGVHPVYLARCVRRWFGVAAADLLRRARLSRAAELLHAKDATVSSIAHETGFSDEAHLCRTFAGEVGSTPGRFRRLIRAFAR